jgi:hypothetical protein
MMTHFWYQFLISLVFSHVCFVQALSNGLPVAKKGDGLFSRRAALLTTGQVMIGAAVATPLPAFAEPECFKDCFKNCKLIAPKDPDYCLATCKEYCEQDDRSDGLSGSVSATSGEVGILGGTFGQGTVPKGEDRVSATMCVPFNLSIVI